MTLISTRYTHPLKLNPHNSTAMQSVDLKYVNQKREVKKNEM